MYAVRFVTAISNTGWNEAGPGRPTAVQSKPHARACHEQLHQTFWHHSVAVWSLPRQHAVLHLLPRFAPAGLRWPDADGSIGAVIQLQLTTCALHVMIRPERSLEANKIVESRHHSTWMLGCRTGRLFPGPNFAY